MGLRRYDGGSPLDSQWALLLNWQGTWACRKKLECVAFQDKLMVLPSQWAFQDKPMLGVLPSQWAFQDKLMVLPSQWAFQDKLPQERLACLIKQEMDVGVAFRSKVTAWKQEQQEQAEETAWRRRGDRRRGCHRTPERACEEPGAVPEGACRRRPGLQEGGRGCGLCGQRRCPWRRCRHRGSRD